MSKYKAIPTDGYASKKEARVGRDLEMLARVGEISQLEKQVRFELIPKIGTQRPVHYVADFRYVSKDGSTHVIDVKGIPTAVYKLKKKLMFAVHQIQIEEL